MRRGVLMVVVFVVVGLAGTGVASAAPQRLASTLGTIVEGPRLAGENVFYGEQGSKSRSLRLAGPGGLIKVANGPAFSSSSSSGDDEEESPGDFSEFSSLIAASPQRLAYKELYASGNARYQVGTVRVTRYGGAVGGAFGQEDSCSSGDIWGPGSIGLDADGSRVAATDCSGQIKIHDYSGPAPATTTVSVGERLQASVIALAGRYVAYNSFPIGPYGSSSTVTTVHDWVADKKVYEIPQARSFDLQEDGTIATSTGDTLDADCSDGKLAWYSVAEPTEHVLPVKPCTSDVRIAGGRIAAVAGAGDELVVALMGLDGSRTNAARLGPRGVRSGTIDFDGARIAYGLGNCRGGADLMTEGASDPQPAEVALPCPVRIASSTTRLEEDERSVPVEIECERGCAGDAAIRMRVKGELRVVASRRIRIAPTPSVPIACAPGIEIKLPSSARTEIRKRRRVAGHLIVTNRDLDGSSRATKRRLTLKAGGTRTAQSECR
ncbi:MAG TPA: hypothetical protein VF712_03495 [Thermoleophilaceae bacterium]|jgi:hypothetical protein